MAPFLHPARLDALELLREQGLTVERDASAGGLRMSGMGAGNLCEGPCRLVHAVCVSWRAQALANVTVGFRGVLLAFVNVSFLSCRHVV